MQQKTFRIERTLAATARRSAIRRIALDTGDMANSNTAMSHMLAAAHDLIAIHKRELETMLSDGDARPMIRAVGELSAAIEDMDRATHQILKMAEEIDDGAKALAGSLKSDYHRLLAQELQERAVHIYEACNFQDIAGQRIGKVIALLEQIEDRLESMLVRSNAHDVPSRALEKPKGDSLLNGPKLDGDAGHASQHDIDKMFAQL